MPVVTAKTRCAVFDKRCFVTLQAHLSLWECNWKCCHFTLVVRGNGADACLLCSACICCTWTCTEQQSGSGGSRSGWPAVTLQFHSVVVSCWFFPSRPGCWMHDGMWTFIREDFSLRVTSLLPPFRSFPSSSFPEISLSSLSHFLPPYPLFYLRSTLFSLHSLHRLKRAQAPS